MTISDVIVGGPLSWLLVEILDREERERGERERSKIPGILIVREREPWTISDKIVSSPLSWLQWDLDCFCDMFKFAISPHANKTHRDRLLLTTKHSVVIRTYLYTTCGYDVWCRMHNWRSWWYRDSANRGARGSEVREVTEVRAVLQREGGTLRWIDFLYNFFCIVCTS